MQNYEIILIILRILFIFIFALSLIPVLVFLERKVSAFIQDRPGPNRANILGIRMGGVIQSLADALKLFFKEDFVAKHIKRNFYFKIAPGILFIASFLSLSIIPFADSLNISNKTYLMQAMPIDIGVLWYLSFASLSVYGIILAGYSSDNKFSLLGSLRAGAQTISYEIPLGLSIISMLITYNSISLNDMVNAQAGSFLYIFPSWGIFMQPLVFFVFITTIFAETNRTPFDLAEGESEIVAGYHTEYSAMRFALFFMAEYVAMVAASALIITIFFGGYNLPYLSTGFLRENAKYILMVLVILNPILIFSILKWVKNNNVTRYKIKIDFRKKENIFYTRFLLTIFILLELLLIYGIFIEVNSLYKQVVSTIIQMSIFIIKTLIMLFVFIWVRWTLPRFRYDQLQRISWEKLVPISIANIVVTSIVVVLFKG